MGITLQRLVKFPCTGRITGAGFDVVCWPPSTLVTTSPLHLSPSAAPTSNLQLHELHLHLFPFAHAHYSSVGVLQYGLSLAPPSSSAIFSTLARVWQCSPNLFPSYPNQHCPAVRRERSVASRPTMKQSGRRETRRNVAPFVFFYPS